jgi:hypothetical protein
LVGGGAPNLRAVIFRAMGRPEERSASSFEDAGLGNPLAEVAARMAVQFVSDLRSDRL